MIFKISSHPNHSLIPGHCSAHLHPERTAPLHKHCRAKGKAPPSRTQPKLRPTLSVPAPAAGSQHKRQDWKGSPRDRSAGSAPAQRCPRVPSAAHRFLPRGGCAGQPGTSSRHGRASSRGKEDVLKTPVACKALWDGAGGRALLSAGTARASRRLGTPRCGLALGSACSAGAQAGRSAGAAAALWQGRCWGANDV